MHAMELWKLFKLSSMLTGVHRVVLDTKIRTIYIVCITDFVVESCIFSMGCENFSERSYLSEIQLLLKRS